MAEFSLNLSADVPREVIVAIAQEVAKILAADGVDTGRRTSGWMTTAQAAEYLGWPVQRLYKLTAVGAIPHRKHGQRLLFDRDELDSWLDAHAHGSTLRGFQIVSKAS